jgi:hypothetical protein
MASYDQGKLPKGEMGWTALVTWAEGSDDRVERYFLELKSDIDLSSKHGQHKVAKFVLGAANRDPDRAAKRFEGHAIMMLGVGVGSAQGISGFEAKDLAREVQKFTGVPGPGWDFERISLANGKDVIAVVVEPPSGQIWPCLSDGEKLTNGDIYLRKDGETAKASGAEVQAMLARTASSRMLPDLDVEVVGEVFAIRLDRAFLESWIKGRAEQYRKQIPDAPGTSVLALQADRRSRLEFLQQVAKWEALASSNPDDGVTELAAMVCEGISLRLSNRTRTFLRDVRVDIDVASGTRALAWREKKENGEAVLFPNQPENWGSATFAAMLGNREWVQDSVGSVRGHGLLRIDTESPARLSMSMDALRPEENYRTADDEVVLVQFLETGAEESVSGRWRLTAGDIDDVLEGDFAIPIRYIDWREAIAAVSNN